MRVEIPSFHDAYALCSSSLWFCSASPQFPLYKEEAEERRKKTWLRIRINGCEFFCQLLWVVLIFRCIVDFPSFQMSVANTHTSDSIALFAARVFNQKEIFASYHTENIKYFNMFHKSVIANVLWLLCFYKLFTHSFVWHWSLPFVSMPFLIFSRAVLVFDSFYLNAVQLYQSAV